MDYAIFALVLLIGQVLLLAAVAFILRRAYLKAKSRALEFFVPAKEGEQSPFGAQIYPWLELVAGVFATKIMQSARAQLSNMSSLNARQSAKLEADAAADSLPAGLGAVPGIGKALQKNPILNFAAQYLLSKMGQPQAAQPPVEAGAHGGNGSGVFSI